MASRDPRQGIPINRPNPTLQTQNINGNNRFSFVAEAPLELQRGGYAIASPTNSDIDESPISPAIHNRAPMPFSPPLAQQYGDDKKAPERIGSPYNLAPPQETHPAHFAPYADADPNPQLAPTLYHSTVPLRTLSPSYPPTNQYHTSQPASPISPAKSYHDTDWQPDVPPISPSTPKPPLYNPNSLAGPNVAAENHMPGQVSHPNATASPHWESSFCGVNSACCLSLVCPCIVYGKTQYRITQKTNKRDGSDLLGYEATNSSCALMFAAFCFSGFLAAIQRTRVRKLYRIEGSVGDDCFKGCCCCCCTLAQDENEMQVREERLRRYAGPASYVSPPGMMYPPPPR
jgi:Cys-rich protein (TIGR01571 family)